MVESHLFRRLTVTIAELFGFKQGILQKMKLWSSENLTPAKYGNKYIDQKTDMVERASERELGTQP